MMDLYPVPAKPDAAIAARMIEAGDGDLGCPTMFAAGEHGWVECAQEVGHEGDCLCY